MRGKFINRLITMVIVGLGITACIARQYSGLGNPLSQNDLRKGLPNEAVLTKQNRSGQEEL